QAGVAQDSRDHRGGSRLSVRTGDGDGVRLESHQFGEHLCARDHRDRTPMRFDDLGIVVAHGSRANEDVWMSDVLSAVTFEDLHAQLLQAIGDVGSLQIRSGDTEAEIDQHLRDAGHADATDAYEMDVLNASKHRSVLATKRRKSHKKDFSIADDCALFMYF